MEEVQGDYVYYSGKCIGEKLTEDDLLSEFHLGTYSIPHVTFF